ncbi:MAG: DNA repair protein RecO [Polyangiaceae bacterium]
MSLIQSEALVMRIVEVRESDVIATLLTREMGKVSAVVRGARKGTPRLGGALEPIHTLTALFDDRGTELVTLKEAQIVCVRAHATSHLESLEAAGTALRWARHLFPQRAPEPEGWRVLTRLLDALDADDGPARAREHLAAAGLAVLAAVGYAIKLDRCVACSRPCPEQRPAYVDPARGGLLCRGCGGFGVLLSPRVRSAARALESGHTQDVTEADAQALLTIVDRAMAAHAGFER